MDWSYPLLAACERRPRLPALRYRGAEATFADLERGIGTLAAGLSEIAAGRVVAWMLPDVPAAVELSMALARVGAVSLPLNPRLTDPEVRFILADARADLLLLHDAFVDRGASLCRPGDHAALAPSLAELRARGAPASDVLASTEVGDDRIATLMYTSGTTGFPKAVMRSHRANAWNVVNSALGSPRSPRDLELINLPTFGIGLLHFAIPALLGGATVLLDGGFDAGRVWELLVREPVTRTFLAPTMISALLDEPGSERHRPTHLELIYTAYEFPAALRTRALDRFGDRFVNMYGLTEAQLTAACPGEFATAPDSVGGAMGAMRVRVVGEDGRPVATGTTGEIAFHGPAVMSGYLGRPEETDRALTDGWLRTGDLGRLDEDGNLHYVGRSKEMIKTGGFSVDPREVESALTAQPEIAEAAVIGVPDPHWGEMVVAYVVVNAPLDEASALRRCRASLAGYKTPKRLIVLDRLPVNATGKVERGRLRERFSLDG